MFGSFAAPGLLVYLMRPYLKFHISAMDVIDMVSIRPNKLSLYKEFVGSRSLSSAAAWKETGPAVQFSESAPEGVEIVGKKNRQPNSTKTGRVLSVKARQRIQEKIEWLVCLSKKKKAFNPKTQKTFNFKINFITLTLPVLQRHHDTTIKSKCLNQFLVEARKYCNLRNYVWRAEAQSNGNIHFHIVSDTYLNAYLVRSIWNRTIAKLGYVDAYHAKFSGLSLAEYVQTVDPQHKVPYHVHADRYEFGRKSNWRSPNTTDIHSTRKIRDIAAYLKKYVSKSITPAAGYSQASAEQIAVDPYFSLKNRRLSGRLWGCSQSLSKLKSITDFCAGRISAMINDICERFPDRVRHFDYASCIYVRIKDYVRYHVDVMKRLIDELLEFTGYRASMQSEQRFYLDSQISFSP